MANPQDKRTASQRLDDLERTVMAAYQTLDQMARDLMTIKEAIKLLGNKTSAIATAANISDETISKLMVDQNVAELKEKVTVLISQGILVASDEPLADSSFVVGQEVDTDGKIVNPRIQFTLGSIQPEIREKIKAGKIGEAIELQEGKLKFLITETYKIVAPKAPEAQAEAAPALAAVPEAPAAEQSSNDEPSTSDLSQASTSQQST